MNTFPALFVLFWAIWAVVFVFTKDNFWAFLALSNLLLGILVKDSK